MKNYIKFYRLKKGITQVYLAKAIGVTQQAVAKWETEDVEVSLKYVPHLAKTLGVRKELLFPDLKNKDSSSSKVEEQIIDNGLELTFPYEIILHFKNRREAYYAELNGQRGKLLQRLLQERNDDTLYFETLDQMMVIANLKQIRMIELGRDLAFLPDNLIENQRLGKNDENFEENGDDRYARMFLSRHPDPFIENFDEDLNPEYYRGLFTILEEAQNFYTIDEEGFWVFSLNSPDEDFRDIFFYPSDIELIEAPTVKYNEYIEKIMSEDKPIKA